MADVSRQEFDELVQRVNRMERTLVATVEVVAAEVVGLRTFLTERFDAIDTRFVTIDTRLDAHGERLDSLEAKLDAYTEQVRIAIAAASETAERHERFNRAIADHFGIEL